MSARMIATVLIHHVFGQAVSFLFHGCERPHVCMYVRIFPTAQDAPREPSRAFQKQLLFSDPMFRIIDLVLDPETKARSTKSKFKKRAQKWTDV